MQYFVISGSDDTLQGFRLAGVGGVRAEDRKQVQDALAGCIDDPDIGVVLITEALAKLCPELIGDLKLRNQQTLVVEIPDRHGTGRAPDSITRYIREAIGVKL